MKPMTFTAANVPLLMADMKTNSRRIMRVQPDRVENGIPLKSLGVGHDLLGGEIVEQDLYERIKPPHQPGDIVYVAEGYQAADYNSIATRTFWFCYLADQMRSLRKTSLTDAEWNLFIHRKKPWMKTSGRFMYRGLARTYLEILDVKAERIQDISVRDCIAEGVVSCVPNINLDELLSFEICSVALYEMEKLWNSIHGPDAWDLNPWVWAYRFKRCEKPEEV